ncbi:GHMP kinase, N-terminal domain-containing protein [Toxoplasma gondii VAND]|uniref:GHMP kinase, N-terminal domain-containing protein n=1 Tax=Toxoplasma gondii VAND TaxID=933077 RepID=A0A086PRU0_TOXGO|nr:GHMP kinase, N-terminal domain-containing protein [Toxoplasma gondii VAND]
MAEGYSGRKCEGSWRRRVAFPTAASPMDASPRPAAIRRHCLRNARAANRFVFSAVFASRPPTHAAALWSPVRRESKTPSDSFSGERPRGKLRESARLAKTENAPAEAASLAAEAVRAFQKAFDSSLPDFLAVAPGRINIIGEHLDYSGYSVLPMAINRFTICAIRSVPHLNSLSGATVELARETESRHGGEKGAVSTHSLECPDTPQRNGDASRLESSEASSDDRSSSSLIPVSSSPLPSSPQCSAASSLSLPSAFSLSPSLPSSAPFIDLRHTSERSFASLSVQSPEALPALLRRLTAAEKGGRKRGEGAREQNEQAREQNEQAREQNEQAREQNEQAREQNEQAREERQVTRGDSAREPSAERDAEAVREIKRTREKGECDVSEKNRAKAERATQESTDAKETETERPKNESWHKYPLAAVVGVLEYLISGKDLNAVGRLVGAGRTEEERQKELCIWRTACEKAFLASDGRRLPRLQILIGGNLPMVKVLYGRLPIHIY